MLSPRARWLTALVVIHVVPFLALAAAAADAQQEVRRQFAAWLRSPAIATPMNANFRSVTESLDRWLAEGKDIRLIVGGNLTTSTRAYYVMSWTGRLHVFDLNATQARAAGLARANAIFGEFSGGARFFTRPPQPLFTLENLQVDRRRELVGDKEISGSVVCRPLGKTATPRLLLRVSLRLENDTVSVATPVAAVPKDGVLRFKIEAVNGRADRAAHFGPMPLFVELIAASDDIASNPVVSNTLADVLDLQVDLDTYARSGIRVWEQIADILAGIRDRASAQKAAESYTRLLVQNQFLLKTTERLGPFTPEQDAAFERKYGARLNATTKRVEAEMKRIEQLDYGRSFLDGVQKDVQSASH